MDFVKYAVFLGIIPNPRMVPIRNVVEKQKQFQKSRQPTCADVFPASNIPYNIRRMTSSQRRISGGALVLCPIPRSAQCTEGMSSSRIACFANDLSGKSPTISSAQREEEQLYEVKDVTVSTLLLPVDPRLNP